MKDVKDRYRRNTLCPCGSMKKYHRCCGRNKGSGRSGRILPAAALAGAVL